MHLVIHRVTTKNVMQTGTAKKAMRNQHGKLNTGLILKNKRQEKSYEGTTSILKPHKINRKQIAMEWP